MRDKQISMPGIGSQRVSDQKTFPGLQGNYRHTDVKPTFSLRIFSCLLLFLLFVITARPASALNQIQNGLFTADISGWDIQQPHIRTGIGTITISISLPAEGGYPTQRALKIYYNIPSNMQGNNSTYPKDCYLQQTFLTARTSAVRARLTSAHKETLSNNDISALHTGTIFKTDSPEIDEAFYRINIPAYDSPAANWTPGATYETILEGNKVYAARLYFDIAPGKNRTATIWVDNITCNVSPDGVVASETVAGKCRLDWAVSSNPVTGVAQINASNSYRIYRSTISDSGPWTQIATHSKFANSYSETPPGDVVHYAISDVDTEGVESPLSLTATFRTAKLAITKVETNTSNVTKGQNGLPIKVYVTNTGYTAARLDTVELVFDTPVFGVYTISAPSPALPLTLAGGQSQVITFLAAVASSSASGVDYIDARVTGINTQTLAPISDNDSDVKASWLIQGPPNLVLTNIQASSTVYIDQSGVGIFLTVRNDGEAAALWDLWNNTELHFTLGTYLNLRPYGVPNPYSEIIYKDQTKTIRYDIDISPFSATGTATINASMSYVDANTYNPYSYNTGDPTPPSWTIHSGILKTYRGPPQFTAWAYEASSFNQGNFSVYVKGLNLQPDREFRLRWYNSAGTQVASNTASTNLSGILEGSYALSDTSPLGKWRVIITRITNEIPLAETYFDVVVPASLSVSLVLPNFATINQPFDVNMLFTNSGGSEVVTAAASVLTPAVGNSGVATYISGPSDDSLNIPPYSNDTISWVYKATAIGSFTLLGHGSGVDSNDLRELTAATTTSNMCMIQNPPIPGITAVYAHETMVSLNQQELLVEVGVSNTGAAAALINNAQLNFSEGTHYQYLSSPDLPYFLQSGVPATLSFLVAVAATSSAPVTATITATFYASDANWPVSTYTVNSGVSDSWQIKSITGYCSADPSFTPEQYNFNSGQIVYVKFSNLPLNAPYRILFSRAVLTPDNAYPVAGNISSGDSGSCNTYYTLPTNASGSWKAELWTSHPSSGQPQVLQSRQFFNVRAAGSIISSMTFSPNDIELNNTTTLRMSVRNPVASSSTIVNVIPSLPIKYTGSIGELQLLTGPEPASATLPSGANATFTWTFLAIDDSGLSGTYQMIATATGNDANLPSISPNYATSSSSISNILKIRFRDLAYASSTLDFGTMVCGATKAVGSSRVNNAGSTALQAVSWDKGHFESAASDILHHSNLTLYPAAPFSVSGDAAASFTLSWASLKMPYNQPAGLYIATMTVFEDMLPYNGVLDAGEPAWQFSSRVIASACQVVYTLPTLIDLGDWNVGEDAATKTISVYNGGNTTLQNLKFKHLAPKPQFEIIITPATYANLATNAVLIASVSAHIIAGPYDEYDEGVMVWNDLNDNDEWDAGEASATFQILVGIGSQQMSFTPNPIDFGNGTPTIPLDQQTFLISNIGDRNLTRLKYISQNIPHQSLPYHIPYDEIELVLPASIMMGATGTAYIDLFIPAGTPIGTYSGDIYVFEDEDGDGTFVGDENEAPAALTVQIHVNPYRGLAILSASAYAGELAALETGVATLTFKNTGNLLLDHLTWEKINLTSGANSMSSSTYAFDPGGFFTKPFNTIFSAILSLTVPPGQPSGEYFGQPVWLFDDLNENGRLLGNDPQVPFTVSCQVGTKNINITEAALLISNASPNTLSAAASFEIRNPNVQGALTLNRPMATATVLTDGTNTIPASASIFIPTVFGPLIKNQKVNGTWQVQVPAGIPVGTYIGTMTAWNDTNMNSQFDDGEVSDTATLQLQVIARTIIGISPPSLEFGYVAPERSASVDFQIVNLGNQEITSTALLSVASWLPPLAPGPIPIPAANLVFSPVPFATNLPVGASVSAVATITIPAGQSSVTYQGTQRIYVDSSAPNGSYTAGEVTATFSARVSVGNKLLSAPDVNMGIHGHATTASTNFTLSNIGDINTNRIRWLPGAIGNGTATLTPTLTPNGSIIAGGTLNCSAGVIIPLYTPAGIYTGIQTVFDDDLLPYNNLPAPNEASDTFLLTLEVAENPGLSIIGIDPVFPVTVSLGQKVFVEVTYQNMGNVTLSDLSWGLPMATMNGSEGDLMVPTFSPAALPALAPGATYVASITFEARMDQATGSYTGVQTLSSTAYPAVTANIAPEVLVVQQTGPKDLGPGTVYQSIATATFIAGGDFIFSVYIGFEDGIPALATVGFRQDKDDDTPATPMYYVSIDQGGNILSENPVGSGGVVSRIKSGDKTWYRVFLKFSGTLDATTDATYLILSNSSDNVGTDVWFDGVQLEKANGRDRPTSYGEGLKIISPNNRTDLEGKARYSDW